MDKTAIRNFSVWARRKLIEDIEQKAYEIGITEKEIKEPQVVTTDTMIIGDRTLNKAEMKQRQSLVLRVKEKGFNNVVEEVAYTWFNRFIAIRFMEVNEYLPTGVRVLSSNESGKKEPDIIKEALNTDLELDRELVYRLQDSHETENLFRYLIVKQCNALNEILPGLFEEIEDYTEILLPENLLAEGSVIRQLVDDISEDDFKEQVEIIGWMYQYYISEKKDEVFEGLKKNIKINKENIPAATQLFTPDWIVKYMVENSLGRLWLDGHPDENLKANWKYYLEEAKQEPDVEKQLEKIKEKSKNIKPEEITILDPCMGSGHILVYAFDVLYEIYHSAGYSERDIPKLILEKNLYGLDIDDRAAQLAYFAVMMKARSKSRRIFRDKISLNLCSIQESNKIPKVAIEYLLGSDKKIDNKMSKFRVDIEYLIDVFKDAKEFGSIIDVTKINFEAIENTLFELKQNGYKNIFEYQYISILLSHIPSLLKQSKIMSKKYDVIVTNPPYMGSGGMNAVLSEKLKSQYPITKGDLSTVFMERSLQILKDTGYLSMINIPSWMFITTYYNFREYLIENTTFINMLHLGRGIFGSDFGTTTFVISKNVVEDYQGVYRRLFQKNGKIDSIDKKRDMFFNNYGLYTNNQKNFSVISGKPMGYWISEKSMEVFKKSKEFDKYIDLTGSQHKTANNEKYLREYWEIDFSKIGYSWISYAKGGKFRKWYGNISLVLDWSNEAINFYKTNKTSNMLADKYLFREGITWSASTAGDFSARILIDKGAFDMKGPSLFPLNEENQKLYLALLNSKVVKYFLDIFSDRHDYQIVDIKRIPYIDICGTLRERISALSEENVLISKNDWDSYEISWDFLKHPLMIYKDSGSLEMAFSNWSNLTEENYEQLRTNEEELNRIFIGIYGLQDELSPGVEEQSITVKKAIQDRDIKSFISYAVGCMFGRYSIDVEGIIFAGGIFKDKWKCNDGQIKIRKTVTREEGKALEDVWWNATYTPDVDNVLPVTDDEYFDDDIVSRFVEFLKVTFSEETLEENLDYISDTLGRKPSETARQTIRRYFLKDFYKDHLQTYQKRPIYWLFDSGKQDGFKALIYMHRYDEFTVAKVRTDYLHKLQKSYEAEIKRLDIVIDSSDSEREKANARKKKEKILKQMEECRQYDQVIAHVANQRIQIDLDDGVSVNYAKFQGIEIPQGDGKKPLKADLLAKI